MISTRKKRLAQAGFVLACLVVVFALSACGGSKEETVPEVDPTKWETWVESPLDSIEAARAEAAGQNPDTLGTEAAAAAAVATATDSSAAPVAVPDPRDFTRGWRVQLAALSSMATADEAAEEARRVFTESVYVEYEPPLYKVRIGDFITRGEADAMATRAHAAGYPNAWVVETLVLRSPR